MAVALLSKETFFRILVYVAIFVVYVRLVESFSIFYPSKKIGATPRDIGLVYEDIFFNTQDGITLNAWFLKPAQAYATILILHGNAGNNSHRLEKISYFYKMGLNIFILDYRGFGKSEGKPSEEGIYADARAAYDYLSKRPDIDPKKIIVYGESLGGAVAVDLATKRSVAALILDSTFPSAADMAKAKLPFIPAFLLKTKLDSQSKIVHLKMPKLFIHSPQDEVVPFKLGKKLFDAAPDPKELLSIQGNHNEGFFQSQELYIQGIEQYLKKWNLI